MTLKKWIFELWHCSSKRVIYVGKNLCPKIRMLFYLKVAKHVFIYQRKQKTHKVMLKIATRIIKRNKRQCFIRPATGYCCSDAFYGEKVAELLA